MDRIWAVAKNTVRQALRMKVAVIFVILLLVLLPVLGLTATGDGTLKGRLQTFVSYGLSLTSLLLCLLTLIVSVYSVTSDIEQRQIYTVVTKPIRRYQLILGKLLGVIVLDIGLLAVFGGIVYSVARCETGCQRAQSLRHDHRAVARLTNRPSSRTMLGWHLFPGCLKRMKPRPESRALSGSMAAHRPTLSVTAST